MPMLLFLKQAYAFLGCILSATSEYIAKHKLHWPLICLVSCFLCYQWGYHNGKSDEKHQNVQIKLAQQKAAYDAVNNTDKISGALANNFISINNTRELSQNEINHQGDALVEQYASPDWVYESGETSSGEHPNPGVPITGKTVVVNLPDGWEFSRKDRATLIREAQRADKTVADLNACKATLNQLYGEHAKYQLEMKKFQEALNAR